MNTKKFFLSGIVGGIVYFFVGYLVYGKLMSDFFMKNAGTASGVNRNMDQYVWWSLVLGNLCMGFLLSFVFVKSGVKSAGTGLLTGAVLGLLSAGSYDFVSFATSNLSTVKGAVADVGVFALMSAVAGAFVGWVCGALSKRSGN